MKIKIENVFLFVCWFQVRAPYSALGWPRCRPGKACSRLKTPSSIQSQHASMEPVSLLIYTHRTNTQRHRSFSIVLRDKRKKKPLRSGVEKSRDHQLRDRFLSRTWKLGYTAGIILFINLSVNQDLRVSWLPPLIYRSMYQSLFLGKGTNLMHGGCTFSGLVCPVTGQWSL